MFFKVSMYRCALRLELQIPLRVFLCFTKHVSDIIGIAFENAPAFIKIHINFAVKYYRIANTEIRIFTIRLFVNKMTQIS